jgi:hypothetical protein
MFDLWWSMSLQMERASLLALTYVLTVAMYAALLALASVPIDPVRWVPTAPSADPSLRYHGQPVLDWIGIIVWTLLVVLYVIIVRLLFGLRLNLWRPVHSSALAVGISLCIVAIVHPLVVPMLLPLRLSVGYVQFFGSSHLPFGPALRSINVRYLLTAVAAVHTIILSTLFLFNAGQRRP